MRLLTFIGKPQRKTEIQFVFYIDSITMIYSYDNFLREYARLSLYGYIIASNFLQILWDPEDIDFSQFYEQAQRLGVDFFIQVNNNNNKGEILKIERNIFYHNRWRLDSFSHSATFFLSFLCFSQANNCHLPYLKLQSTRQFLIIDHFFCANSLVFVRMFLIFEKSSLTFRGQRIY